MSDPTILAQQTNDPSFDSVWEEINWRGVTRWKPMLWTGTMRMERDPLSQTELPVLVTRSLVPLKLP